MRALFIVNPAAGAGRGGVRWDGVRREVLAAQAGFEAAPTSEPGEAARLARRGLEQGFETLVAVGGDGTLAEVVEGFLTAPPALRAKAAVTTWPAGSGCDLARHLGIAGTAAGLRALLARGRVAPLDAGLCELTDFSGRRVRRHFLSVAGLGLAAEVARRAAMGAKAWGGTAGYFVGALSALWAARPAPLDLIVDGAPRPRASFQLLTLSNTTSAGGGMRIAPGADPRDGLFDLLTVGPLSRLELARRLPLVYSGRHLGVAGVGSGRLKRLAASSPEAVLVNLDGELPGTLPASFEVLAGALPFLCP